MKNQKKRKSYESDLTDEEWRIIEPLLPQSKEGKPRIVKIREIINAINYLFKVAEYPSFLKLGMNATTS